MQVIRGFAQCPSLLLEEDWKKLIGRLSYFPRLILDNHPHPVVVLLWNWRFLIPNFLLPCWAFFLLFDGSKVSLAFIIIPPSCWFYVVGFNQLFTIVKLEVHRRQISPTDAFFFFILVLDFSSPNYSCIHAYKKLSSPFGSWYLDILCLWKSLGSYFNGGWFLFRHNSTLTVSFQYLYYYNCPPFQMTYLIADKC